MKILKWAALAGGIAVGAEIYRELHNFCVTHYDITSRKLTGLKEPQTIVFLSDLHNHVYGKNNRPLLEAVQSEKPDHILIGGDMLVGKKGHDYSPALDFVKKLIPICPVYYANGNHEQRMKERPWEYGDVYGKYRQELLRAGVRFLENESDRLDFGNSGISVQVTGLEIPSESYGRFRRRQLTGRDIAQCIGDCGGADYEILLAHNPSYMNAYLDWGADLVLSGHMHGGIVRIPGISGVISPAFEILPKYSGGCYREGEQTAVVSRGLGSHTIPVRLFNPAEVVVLRLSGADEGCVKGSNPV